MNDKEDSTELLDWNKKNIVRFAQFLYDLARERVQIDRVTSRDEFLEETIETERPIEETTPELEGEAEVLEEPEIEQEVLEEPEIEQEVLEEPEIEQEIPEEPEIEQEIPEEPEAELEIPEEPEEDKLLLDKELQEVTIGLAKAVSGEEVGEIGATDQAEIQEIIEKEHIPLPSESKEDVNAKVSESLETSLIPQPIEQAPTQETEADDHTSDLDTVDLSYPIVKEPVINEEILIQPENIPQDIHNMIFVEETTSVPITKDEIIIKTIDAPSIESEIESTITEDEITTEVITEEIEPEIISEQTTIEDISITEAPTDVIIPEEEPIIETIEPPAELISEEVLPEPEAPVDQVTGLDEEAAIRRQEIINQMLGETKKREEQEGFKVRELGETAGRNYSAVVFGNESNKNVKKWKKWEKRRLRQEKKKKKN